MTDLVGNGRLQIITVRLCTYRPAIFFIHHDPQFRHCLALAKTPPGPSLTTKRTSTSANFSSRTLSKVKFETAAHASKLLVIGSSGWPSGKGMQWSPDPLLNRPSVRTGPSPGLPRGGSKVTHLIKTTREMTRRHSPRTRLGSRVP